MLDYSFSPSATTQKYSTARGFSLSYPPIPERGGVRLPMLADGGPGVAYTVTLSHFFDIGIESSRFRIKIL